MIHDWATERLKGEWDVPEAPSAPCPWLCYLPHLPVNPHQQVRAGHLGAATPVQKYQISMWHAYLQPKNLLLLLRDEFRHISLRQNTIILTVRPCLGYHALRMAERGVRVQGTVLTITAPAVFSSGFPACKSFSQTLLSAALRGASSSLLH